jgi:NAD(P)-dependent dehydrogenase (short-subunit alcohol dehydrogenase family)
MKERYLLNKIILFFRGGKEMQVDMKGKVAVITGSTTGIGHGIATLFARNGARVVINSHVEEHGAEVVQEIKEAGGDAVFIKANIADVKEAQLLADKTVEAFGQIDILVNNAGINVPMKERGPIHEFFDENWRKIINVDLDGVYYCSKAALKHMTKRGYGKIVNISSIVGAVPLRNQCAFAAAKAGVINLTKAMAIELASYGVNVNAILPGSIQVAIMNESGMYTDGRFESIISHIPQKKPGKPEDIAYGALYLASDAANYVTGSILVIDGGWTCGFARDW